MHSSRIVVAWLAAQVLVMALPGQDDPVLRREWQVALHRLADWRAAYRPFQPAWNWLDDGGLWFREQAEGGERYVRVGADGSMHRAASAAELGIEIGPHVLEPQARWRRSAGSGRETRVHFANALDRPVRLFWIDGDGQPRQYGELAPGAEREQHTYAGHVWLADFAADDLAGIFVAEERPGVARFDARSREIAMAPPEQPHRAGWSPTGDARLFVRDHEVWLSAGGEADPLTDDGSAEDPYRLPRHWSPDGTRVLGFQVELGERHEIHLVESTPQDRLEPRLHTFDYRKPGDRIDRPRPRLFDVAARRRVRIDDAAFADAWSIDHVRWADDGHEVYCLYNRRGHQLLRLCAIDAATGAVRTVVEERSDTFVDYSQKTFLHWLAGGREVLWASERDGWNHLYRVDVASGAVTQLTRGPWLVREVEHVDEQRGELWCKVMGVYADQDPYHVHLARIPLAGGEPTVVTSADGTHEWTFSPDRSRVVVRWSRVDQPWVTELRDAQTGALLAELGRDDVTSLTAAGFAPPRRFVAKGRDGTTDIHGLMLLPSSFDPTKRYPVLEDIYAGPHDHHVPKAFGLGRRQRELAELGFVVVQIDGMGTNWRHKAFHDVCWRNLADAGLPDRIAWLRTAQQQFPFLDLDRVGIFGGSAGGQNALAALLHHGDFYKAAVADCGCHDNRMDKIWWNEAWMGWPIGPWYEANSNTANAARLQGALLLTVGELDRNVDPSSTMQVVKALIDADKDFEMVVVPGGGHGVGESDYLRRRRGAFFRRWLGGPAAR